MTVPAHTGACGGVPYDSDIAQAAALIADPTRAAMLRALLSDRRAGASGFLLKDVRPAELVAAIRTVAAGNAVVSPGSPAACSRSMPRSCRYPHPSRNATTPQLSTLTEREREVLVAVAQGLSNAEIAATFFVSEATVKSHVGRILAKLGLRDRVQVVVLAYETGLVRPGARPAPGPRPGPTVRPARP